MDGKALQRLMVDWRVLEVFISFAVEVLWHESAAPVGIMLILCGEPTYPIWFRSECLERRIVLTLTSGTTSLDNGDIRSGSPTDSEL